jgi:hypothetical protein
MDKILYIGGMASNSYQVKVVSDELERHYGLNVIGMTFREAQQNLALVARLAAESLVITHSAGMMVLKYITPLELIAIAPPMPVSIPRLIMSNIPRTYALLKSYKDLPERRSKILRYNRGATIEHIVHPRYNAGQVRKLSIFDAAKEAVAMTTNGAKVTLCLMGIEHVFTKTLTHPHIDIAKEHGVIVHENVPGQHDEFLLYPLEVLAGINRL